jgi:hypothetical protein
MVLFELAACTDVWASPADPFLVKESDHLLSSLGSLI